MHRTLVVSLLAGCLLLPVCAAKQKSVTVTDASAAADDAVAWLVKLNGTVSDDAFHSGEWDRAISGLVRMTVLNPTDYNPYASAAWLLWSSGKREEAVELYHRMVAANPKEPDAYFEVGYFYINQKNDAEAVKWLEQAVALGLSPARSHAYGHALQRLGRNADALAFWQRLLEADPKNEVARRQIEHLRTLTPEKR